MPGAYAHLIIVENMSSILDQDFDRMTAFPAEIHTAFNDYINYCQMGAVSPDYPYLALTDPDSTPWADKMHHFTAIKAIRAGIDALRGLTENELLKCLAWLLGYASHVAADTTVHPVVNKIVGGPYEDHKTDHRICEMHQDTYIWQQVKLGPIGLAEYLDRRIGSCGDPDDKRKIDPAVKLVWLAMLQGVDENGFNQNRPSPDLWHNRFIFFMDNIAEESYRLPPFARHVAVGLGLTYPIESEINHNKYINNIPTPDGKNNYSNIFQIAVNNTAQLWSLIGQSLFKNIDNMPAVGEDWSLDSGLDDKGNLVYWS